METAPPFEIFRCPLRIREHHLDTFGHVNNATYLQLLEAARWDLITPRGFGLSAIKKSGMGPTILEWNLKYRKELLNRQDYTIESQVISYDRKVGVMRQDILDEENEICFEGRLTFGLFSLAERKLILPTPEWLRAIGVRSPKGPAGA